MKAIFAISMLIFCSFSAHASDSDPLHSEVQQIEMLLNEFLSGIERQDRSRIVSMFLDESAPFVSFVPDKSEPRIQASTVGQFADLVLSKEQQPREVFRNLDINIYETTATAVFDYTFLLDDAPLNFGHEIWTLVKGARGWKAISVVWSTNFPN